MRCVIKQNEHPALSRALLFELEPRAGGRWGLLCSCQSNRWGCRLAGFTQLSRLSLCRLLMCAFCALCDKSATEQRDNWVDLLSLPRFHSPLSLFSTDNKVSSQTNNRCTGATRCPLHKLDTFYSPFFWKVAAVGRGVCHGSKGKWSEE